jgi:hypothetical protein
LINLNLPTDREKLEQLITDDINKFCETYYESGHRNHLGASEMGEECWRKLWYKFRWVKREQFSGRMLRLFNVGHQAEPRFIAYLEALDLKLRNLTKTENNLKYLARMLTMEDRLTECVKLLNTIS